MEIIETICLIISALCVLVAVVYFAGPGIIVWLAAVGEYLNTALWERIEAKAEEWRELINAAKEGK